MALVKFDETMHTGGLSVPGFCSVSGIHHIPFHLHRNHLGGKIEVRDEEMNGEGCCKNPSVCEEPETSGGEEGHSDNGALLLRGKIMT